MHTARKQKICAVVAPDCNPSVQEEESLWEFEDSLVYRGSFGTARATEKPYLDKPLPTLKRKRKRKNQKKKEAKDLYWKHAESKLCLSFLALTSTSQS